LGFYSPHFNQLLQKLLCHGVSFLLFGERRKAKISKVRLQTNF